MPLLFDSFTVDSEFVSDLLAILFEHAETFNIPSFVGIWRDSHYCQTIKFIYTSDECFQMMQHCSAESIGWHQKKRRNANIQ